MTKVLLHLQKTPNSIEKPNTLKYIGIRFEKKLSKKKLPFYIFLQRKLGPTNLQKRLVPKCSRIFGK